MELGPTKVSSRSATVTIHTAHIAFVDLGSHACPSLVHHHAADLGELLSAIAMVELEHDRICVAAVNAWMCPEVGKYFAPILDTMSLDLRDRATDIVGLVREVMGVSIDRMADTAIGIE